MAQLTDHNVVATFPSLDEAREAIVALGRAGIDAEDVSLLGRQVREVESDPDTRVRDLESTEDLAKNAAVGGTAGSVVGGILGAAAFAIPGIGPVVGSGIWAALAGGAIAGATVGGLIGAIGGVELGPQWEATYGDALREGQVVVAVHAHDDEDAETAAKVLSEEGAGEVRHVDGEGKSLGG